MTDSPELNDSELVESTKSIPVFDLLESDSDLDCVPLRIVRKQRLPKRPLPFNTVIDLSENNSEFNSDRDTTSDAEAFNPQKKKPKFPECTICLDPVGTCGPPITSIQRKGKKNPSSLNTDVLLTSCGHLFCGKCIVECLAVTNKCPVCRTPHKIDGLRPIYL